MVVGAAARLIDRAGSDDLCTLNPGDGAGR